MLLSSGGHGGRPVRSSSRRLPHASPLRPFGSPAPGRLRLRRPHWPDAQPQRQLREGRRRQLSRRVRRSVLQWRRSAAQTWARSPEREERRLRGRGSGGCPFRAEHGSSFLSAPPPPHCLATGHRPRATGFFPTPPPPADQSSQRPPGTGRVRGGYARRERPSP